MRTAITPQLQTPSKPKTLPQPPPGTNQELCDDESGSVLNQPTNGVDSSPTNNGRHCYPRRNRVAPNYYHDEIELTEFGTNSPQEGDCVNMLCEHVSVKCNGVHCFYLM